MSALVTRRNLLGGAAAAATLASLGARPRAQAPVRAGFVYVGPVGDHGWTYGHDVARRELEAALGDQITTSFVENVSEGPDAERVIRQLAAAGNNLVFATSFGFMNAAVRVAQQFPDVKFEHCTGYKTAPNLAVYNARIYEARAVCGHIAGRMSKTGTAGYIASFPIPEVVVGINAVFLAARAVNPDFQIRIVWLNSWYDPGKEADAAKALIDQGADIIVQETDSPAAIQVAEERGVHAFGHASDMRKFAPSAQLTAIVYNWGPYYIERGRAVLDGTWATSGGALRRAWSSSRPMVRRSRPRWPRRRTGSGMRSSRASCTRSRGRSATRRASWSSPRASAWRTRTSCAWTTMSRA